MFKTTKLLAILASASFALNANSAEIFTVTDDVLNPAPRRFGMNLSGGFGSFSPWASDVKNNKFNFANNFEPINIVHQEICDDGGEDYLEHSQGAQLHWFRLIGNDYWNGAECNIFRVIDGSMKLIRTDIVKKCIAGPGTENRLYFEKKGPKIEAGDMYTLRLVTYEHMQDKMNERFHNKPKNYRNFMPISNNRKLKTSWIIDKDPCPEGGSTTSMKLTISGAKGDISAKRKSWGGMYEYWIRDNGSWLLLKEGDYKLQIWMKQKDMSEGKVQITVGQYGTYTLDVGPEWKKYVIDLPAETYLQLAKELKPLLKNKDAISANEALIQAGLNKGKLPFSLYKLKDAKGKDPQFCRDLAAEYRKGLELFDDSAGDKINANRIKKFCDAIDAAGDDAKKLANAMKKVKSINAIVSGRLYSKLLERWYSKQSAAFEKLKVFKDGMSAKAQEIIKKMGEVVHLTNGTIMLSINAPNGTLWIDNYLIYDDNLEKFAVLPWVTKELKNFKGGSLRIWTGLDSPSLDDWLKDGFAIWPNGSIKGSIRENSFSLYQSLKLCKDTGSDPWLIIHPTYKKKDILGLMEYLYGDENTKYGKIRAAQGQKKPWSEVFDKIFLECCNEAWNAKFSPKAWPANPEIYTALANRMNKIIKTSEYYDKEQVQLLVNGWSQRTRRGSWSSLVSDFSTDADYIDYGHYFGGWDGITVIGKDDDHLYSTLLMFSPHMLEKLMITGLNMDPKLASNIAGILIKDNDLKTTVQKTLRSKEKWSKEQITLAKSGDLAKDMAEVFSKDTEFIKSLEKSVSKLKGNVEDPVKKFLIKCSGLPAFEQAITDLIGLPTEMSVALAKTAPRGPGGLSKFFKKYPESIPLLEEIWKGQTTGAMKNHAKRSLSDLEKVKKNINGKIKVGWSIPNYYKALIAPALLKLVNEDAKYAEAYKNSFSGFFTKKAISSVLQSLNKTINDIIARKSDQICSIMKSDNNAYDTILKNLANEQDFFLPASKELAKSLTDALLKAVKVESKKGAIGFGDIPKEVAKRLESFMGKAIKTDATQKDKALHQIAEAILKAVNNDPSQLEKLATSELFIKTIQKRLYNFVGDALLETMKDDGDINYAILEKYNLIPKPGVMKQAVYESGPGYALPGPGKEAEEDSEKVGKSLALGIVTLDSFMSLSAQGFGPQGYFNFKMGTYWATHNNWFDLYPNPSWEVLEMRNNYCSGKMMVVKGENIRKKDIPKQAVYKAKNSGAKVKVIVEGRKNIPLTQVYAFKDGKKHSVLMFNRSLKESTEIVLNLPYNPKSKAVQYILTSDNPKLTNRVDYNIKMQTKTVNDYKNGYKITLPASSLIIITNEEK